MKMGKMLILATVSTSLLISTADVEGFGLTLGPFDLRFSEDNSQGYNQYDGSRRETVLDNPICRAISQQKKLEFQVEGKEKINSKEMKITTKRVIVEPYAFGFTKDRQPVLRGTVVDEKLVREVTIKFGEDQLPDEENRDNDQNQVSARAKESDNITVEVKKKGEEQNNKSFSGLFRSHKSKENVESLNIRNVSNIRILENSHFEVPKNLNTLFKDDIAQVVCQVTPSSSDSQPQKDRIDTKDSAATEQDSQLNAIIRDKLSNGLFSKGFDKTIVIKTNNGAVTINGTVDKAEDIQKVGGIVGGIAGVKKLNNQLTVKNN